MTAELVSGVLAQNQAEDELDKSTLWLPESTFD